MSLSGILLISLALVILNGIYVAAEFALLAAPRPTLERKAARKDSAARRLLEILSSPTLQDRYVATAQLGITLASLGLGMYGEHTLAAWLEPRLELAPTQRFMAAHTLASVIAVAVLTYLHVFIGEMIPKAIALSHAEGSSVPRDTVVGLTVSKGPAPVPIPDVSGQKVDEATATLQGAGFPVTGVEGSPNGKVIATDPPAGEPHQKGTSVRLFTRR